MVSRKRSRSDVDPAPSTPAQPEEPGLLQRLRDCWEFASLMQYITMFGTLMKIDEDFDIDDLENECLKTEPSQKLLEIGLCMLKWVSSHRGLTFDNFDEFTRRQYNAKAPHKENPFGYEEQPNKFLEFDVFLKLRVLHQLSVWTFWNADRIRAKMPEQREIDQTAWRCDELGYDRNGDIYYVLDDNRLYRRTDPPIPAPKPKPKARSKSARAMRASKRRKVSAAADDEEASEEKKDDAAEDDNGGITWECVAATLPDYREFLDSISKTRDPDEKYLRDRILEEVMPVIEKEEEVHERKRLKREKELANLQMMAGAKRSGRLAQKHEKERLEREAAETARKHEEDLAQARREQAEQQKRQDERESRVMTREQRLKDREQKRLLHEAELERITEEQAKLERGEHDGRVSERHLQSEWEKQKKGLEELQQDDHWIFDCSGCGTYGENLDDGSHSVACERCSVWQHSKCLGIGQDEAEKDEFHFICRDCKRREAEAKLPKLPPLKFKVGGSNSPPSAAVAPPNISNGPPTSLSPMKGASSAASNLQNGSESGKPISQPPLPPPSTSQFIPHPPSSPERRPQTATQGPFATSSPTRAPFSPSKSVNGFFSPQRPKPQPGPYTLPPIQQTTQLPPHGFGSFDTRSFPSQRPSSAHSAQSPPLPSPIKNRPSMSPTQGNRDVGYLAGFQPLAASHNGSVPFTPSGQHYARTASQDFSSSMHGGYPPFSAATPSGMHSSPPQSSYGAHHLSGISPTKNSPRPLTSGSFTGAPVLPPIQTLEPSPKLMGRSSPDAPVPSPMKCMTPDQEERKHRENTTA